MTLTVCIGSGCHVRGARRIIEFIQSYIKEHQLEDVTLKGCFCQNKCNDGVVIKFNDLIVKGVSIENIKDYLKKYLSH